MVFFATCAANQQDILEHEIKSLGIEETNTTNGGVEFECDLEIAYTFTLYTRVASRLMLALYKDDDVINADELHQSAMQIPWEDWLTPETTFSISQTVKNCMWLKNAHFAAIRLKDAIVDRIKEKYEGERPNVEKDDPDVSFHLHVRGDSVIYFVDFSGRKLHKRGYRLSYVEAAMRETLAATVIKRSEYRRILEDDELEVVPPLLDPFCGAGTILIEAALWASKVAPGLIDSDRYAFFKLHIHDEEIWKKVIDKAIQEEEEGSKREFKFYGWDIDPKAIEIAKKNAQAAGVLDKIEFAVKDFTNLTSEDIPSQLGYIITDPPYGVRLQQYEIEQLYTEMGKTLNEFFGGWHVSILCGEKELLGYINMKPNRTNKVMNANIPCQIAHYYVFNDEERQEFVDRALERKAERLAEPLSEGSQTVFNRLKKNLDKLLPQMEKDNVTNFRIYDADMPEYSASIDMYDNKYIVLSEYAAPSSIDEEVAAIHLEELVAATERATNIDMDSIYVKTRDRQRGTSQYEKLGSKNNYIILKENDAKYLVNFTDYLDTGIFLDHRPIRKKIKELAKDARFLNLFCYTGTATVQAALGGALSTVSVDSSTTYLDWAMKNMDLNFCNSMNHFYYKEDCMNYLYNSYDRFDLIFCDPPTFSNGKGRDNFDVQQDHKKLIHLCMRHLDKDGTVIFSTNNRRFELDDFIYQDYDVKNITEESIGLDFEPNPRIHQCYLIRERQVIKVRKKPVKIVKKELL